jgi:fructose-1,6-bisphosphatase/inositol monophosphatase family enzyme
VRTQEILQLLQDVAEEVINPRFRTLTEDQVAEKNPGDLVTVADREAEVRITEALQRAYPDALVLGEEATALDGTVLDRFRDAGHAFTVDPVDGTKNFVAGSPDHAVMVAELRDGDVVRSWIWQPQHARAYVAERDAGAWCNGIRLVRPPVGAAPRGVTSRRRWIGRSVDGLAPLELTWVCCGVDYSQLVEGAADYLVYARALPWDHAPGALLLTESGGQLGTFDGEPYRPQDELDTGLVAAGDRATYDRVRRLVGELP